VRTIIIASARRPPAIVRFLLSAVIVFVVYFMAGTVFGLIGSTPLARAVYASVLLLMLLWSFSALLFSLDQVRSPLLDAAGLPLDTQTWRDAAAGLGFGVAAVSVVVVVVAIGGTVRFEFTGLHPVAFLLSFWALVAAALVEELVFRGYPLHRLIEAIGAPAAVTITSCLFGLAHLRNPHASLVGAINTAAIGALLAITYVRTRALWLSWGIHFGWNLALGLGYGLVVSGYSEFSAAITGTLGGPQWLTGGDYGIEASVTSTIVILVLILVLRVLVKQRPAPEVVITGRPSRIVPEPTDGPKPGIQ